MRLEAYKDLDLMDLEGEIWKDIYGYENMYQVSNKGRIKSFLSNKILKQWFCGNNQLMVTLCIDGIKNKIYVIQIVGGCFIGFPKKGSQYCHLDSNKLNNSIDNISIETVSSRALLSYHNGVLKDWGIKNAGKNTQFVQKYKFIGTDKKGIKTEYNHNEMLLKYGAGVRSIYRVIEGKPNFNSAYGQTWERVALHII
jgi:hypothetical protein